MKYRVKTRPFLPGKLLISLAVLVGTVVPRARAFEFEYWPKAIVTIPLHEHWQVGVEEWLSFSDNARRFKDTQTDLTLTYLGLADWLSVGGGYKRIFAKDGDDWLTEDRPYANLTVKTKVRGFGLVDRSRFEYRMPEDEEQSWRYRNRLNVLSPVTFTSLKIQPYTATEVFYSFDGEGFSQQRLYGGAFIPLHKNVRLELFYLWKLDKCDDEWHDTNVLGSWVYFQF
ncbi:MAG: DUF2490 domain-containing protein [Planctomycetes bacterium]|nr:DUF2490 domain-containing protein [Planctomycetota bacterium]